MNFKKICLMIVLSIMLFGCSSKKIGTDVDGFKATMETKGFVVQEDTMIAELDNANTATENVESIVVAAKEGDDNTIFVYFDIENEQYAKEVFEGYKTMKQEMEEVYDDLSIENLSGANWDSVEMIGESFYAYISRVNNDIVMAISIPEQKTSISEMVKELKH